MESVFYGIVYGIKYLFCDATVLCVIGKNGVGRFEELIKDDFLLIVDDSASGKLEP